MSVIRNKRKEEANGVWEKGKVTKEITTGASK